MKDIKLSLNLEESNLLIGAIDNHIMGLENELEKSPVSSGLKDLIDSSIERLIKIRAYLEVKIKERLK